MCTGKFRYLLLKGNIMSHNIIDEIRWMKHNYREHHDNYGEILCLDANAEAKLAACLTYDKRSLRPDGVTSIRLTQISTPCEILQNGIRHLKIIICGMKLKFDCPSFCIENKEISTTTETLPYNEFPIKLADS